MTTRFNYNEGLELNEERNVSGVKQQQLTEITLDEKTIIETLRECMDLIQKQMSKMTDNNMKTLTDRTLIMWELSSDINDSESLSYNVLRAAAYIIVDQLLFYDLLQRHNTNHDFKKLEPLRENESPKDLYDNYMMQVIKVTNNYKPIFDFEFFSLLPNDDQTINALNESIEKITSLNLPMDNTDFLGKIFHSMIPSEIRKGLAAYYTGSAPALLLARLAITKPEAKVCDLACGSGTLLVESYHVKRDLYREQHPEMSENEVHNKMLTEEIYGNDITLFASHLAAMNLVSQNLNCNADRINITSTDGLKINANGELVNSASRLVKFPSNNKHIETRSVNSDTASNWKNVIFPKMDCVIMNPPFSRNDNLSEEMRSNISKTVSSWFIDSKSVDKYVYKRMGLHCYFIIHADHLLKKGGVMAMVLPASTFTTEYGKKIQRYLKDKKYHVEILMEILSARTAFSEDCAFKEYIIVCRKGTLKENSIVKMVTIKDEFDLEQVNDILNAINENKKHPLVSIQTRTNTELYKTHKWSKLFLKQNTSFNKIMSSTMLEYYQNNTSGIHISTGFHSSYVRYMMLFDLNSDKIEAIKKQKKDVWGLVKLNDDVFRLDYIPSSNSKNKDSYQSCLIPTKYLVPSLRATESANTFIAKHDCYTLSLPPELPEELSEFHRNYIKWAEKKIEKRWEYKRQRGYKRNDIIKEATFKTNQRGERVYDKTPWFHHVKKNGCDKSQHNLITRKYTLRGRKSFSIYSYKPVTVNGIFYYIKDNSDKLFASWMASSIYIMNLFQNHQILTKDYASMRISNFNNIKFPKIKEFNDELRNELISKFDALTSVPNNLLPYFPQQIGMNKIIKGEIIDGVIQPDVVRQYEPLRERVELDNAWLKVLGVNEKKEIDEIRNEIYNWLINYIKTY